MASDDVEYQVVVIWTWRWVVGEVMVVLGPVEDVRKSIASTSAIVSSAGVGKQRTRTESILPSS